jgi:chitinase
MVSTKTGRKQFIDSAIAYSHKYGFDGIDIDWEFPGDSIHEGSQDDFPNFITFLNECQESFHKATPSLFLSITAPPFVPYGIPSSYKDDPNTFFRWIADCSRYVDRINIMAYDYHGPFEDPKITGANAPLNSDTNPLSTHFIAKTLEYYLDNGVEASKIVLGMPAFGHSYAGVQGMSNTDAGPGKPYASGGSPGPSTRMVGFLSYYEIADMIAQKRLSFGTDSLTSTAYGYHLASQSWVSFDTPDTIALKTKMALSKGLGGVMLWTVDMDEYQWEPTFPNIRSAWKVLNQ